MAPDVIQSLFQNAKQSLEDNLCHAMTAQHIAGRGAKGAIGQLNGIFKTGGGRRGKDQSHHDQSWINARGFHIDRQGKTLF